ncbi:hypothetical protein JX265_009626 [Neoarthrinium moseri]|uniref:GPI anchored serine-rich protein n=1 Tax=Neoarthrinium moseri TaxID=1658444 RepID=A0A9Q0AKY6_9PEZI|nr:uncharacterized protein JN550_010861 [Neoarthrinium moseri]KAI1844111.1 hypothetical protein JX266_009784 [Neoarthrinium moseri]KAI1861007.1 hypothetical protein JX265_009626 [Neoarthrinium moseri]KAI1861331.1 hypothetical protein JN550_010861 [Neoarthrinium moseri]
MRFATVAAVFAGAVSAKTVYSTDYVTVTSCAPEVTDCPARSTATYSSVYPVGPASSSYPVVPSANTTAPYPVSYPATTGPAVPTTVKPATSGYPVESKSTSPATGVSSVLTISTTTCIPTVIYSTVTATPYTVSSAKPSAGTTIPGHNATVPAVPSSTYPVTAGAGSVAGSLFAAAAGLAVAVMM